MTAVALEARARIAGEERSRVALTEDARDLLLTLMRRHGPLMFHQSGGCCDGSSPMCYPAGEFLTGDADVLLGTFRLPAPEGMPAGLPGDGGADARPADEGDTAGPGEVDIDFWMSREQFEYWKHTHLTVDVVDGRGSGFSVEAPEGKRFLIRSALMED